MKCDAKAKSTGKKCRRNAVPGLTKCRLHCGLSPEVAAEKGRVNLAYARIGEWLTENEIPYVDPLEALLLEVGRSHVVVQALGSIVAKLKDPTDAVVTEVETAEEGERKRAVEVWVDAIYGPTHTGDFGEHVAYSMWTRARKHHASVCKMALDAGVAERQVRIAEAQGQLLARVVSAILDDPQLKLTAKQRQIAPKVARKHLELVG